MTLTTNLTIEAGDVQIDAIGEYGAETGILLNVSINGMDIDPDTVAAALATLNATDEAGGWDDDLCEAELTELANQAAQDAADDYGDWAMEMRRDG